ncbi:hypothetical protein LQ757_06010 [Agromyces sp. SYSU K20354]|uniref:hypothetical protein n=1 Tax=Agromyces cavernae TaxID=2898659 RepID=UPI001E2D9C6B|nr:hypothetical protein [Agromyces cavernae]MCD2441831.1 hypothetical protein [Agromyces cavernae]
MGHVELERDVLGVAVKRNWKSAAEGTVAIVVAMIAMTGCAKQPQLGEQASEAPADEKIVISDCGGTTWLEYDESPGEPTRARAIEAMIERWRKAIDEGIESVAGGEREFPDGIITFELALEALPEAERDASADALLRVEAINPEGEDWGTVVVMSQPSGGYLIESYEVSHENGEACPPIE